MKIELEEGVWLCDGEGDPSMTIVEDWAKSFNSEKEARAALTEARKFRPFKNAQLIEDMF